MKGSKMSESFTQAGEGIPLSFNQHAGKVLIVDDEPDVLVVLGKRLANAGFDVVPCNRPEEALDRARKVHPDLIVLDVLMPGIDGVEVARRIRACKDTSAIPIMFLSCMLTNWGKEQGDCLLENTTYMSKPYQPEQLLERVGQLVRQHREMTSLC